MKLLCTKNLLTFLLLLVCGIYMNAQQTINGMVTNEDQSPLIGANILEVGTTNGVVTDIDGKFQIQVAEGAELQITYTGYEDQTFNVDGKDYFDIIMKEGSLLDEVIVTGYRQTQNKRSVSTAIATLNSDRISALPVSRPEQLLQGTAPGLSVSQNSGSPGAPLTIRLRGISTAGDASPLILVDGVQVPNLNFLNAIDIENISVLKDGAASAIYGSRGGNGVLLYQTRKGSRNTPRPNIRLDGYVGFQNIANKPELMNRDQYVQYYNEYASANDLPTIDNPSALPDTDWYEETFDDNAPMSSINASISGGSQRSSYYVSAGRFSQDGLVGGDLDKSNFLRKNFRLHYELDVLPTVNLSLTSDFVNTDRNYLFENNAGTFGAVLNYINALPAIFPVFDANGAPFDMSGFGTLNVNGVTTPGVGAVSNPQLSLLHSNNNINNDIINFKGGLNWEITDRLNAYTSFATYRDEGFERQFVESFDYREFGHSYFNDQANYTERNYFNNFNQWEGNLSFDVFQEGTVHGLTLLGGFSVLESESGVEGKSGAGFFVNDFDDVNFSFIRDASTITTELPQEFETGLFSLYARAVYDYKGKYLLTASIRSDESSKFGEDNRQGIFPAVSAGYLISEEPFFNSSIIDLLKVRASWGINGNDNIAPYQANRVVSTNEGPTFGGNNTSGIALGFLSNPGVKWEEVSQTNFGIDLNAFESRVGVTLDYYLKKTTDMLIPIGVPAYIGLNSPFENIADVENQGLELILAYRSNLEKEFKWNAAINLGTNENEVTSLGDLGQPINGGTGTFVFPDPITRTDEGLPIASFYGFELSQITSEGAFEFVDQNNDGNINADDKVVIGDPYPDFTYGLTLGFDYKGFDFSAFFFGQQGNDIYDATTRLDSDNANRPVSYLDAGAPANLLVGAVGSDQTAVSDFYVKDGSFTKLRTLTLGYTLPGDLLSKIFVQSARIYITGQNLLVITDYDGADPEIGQSNINSPLDIGIDRGFYPQSQSVLFGLQVNF